MRLFLNELSLPGMQSHEELQRIFVDLMEARRRSPNLARVLYCSRRTGDIQALHGERLLISIARMERDKRSAILAWLGKSGPFLYDGREETDEDLYHLFGSEVTDLGPGEAARQRQQGSDGRLLSFVHRRDVDFNVSFLVVVHDFPDEPIAEIKVPNIVSLADAKNAADRIDPEPGSWPELLDISRRRFGRLLIGTHCDEVLLPLTFYPAVARRTLELLKVLDEIAGSADDRGALSTQGKELVQTHFVGEKAWFTDELDENKRLFGKAMTFPNPANANENLQCFWHGKIKTPQFRIHFEWPLRGGLQVLKVAYIGPKIAIK